LLSNPYWLAVSLAIGFELGAAASLASLVILDKMNKTLVWILFGAITLMQMQGNMYYAFSHMENFQGWSELFGLIEEDIIYQKRILAAVSGAILPLVALGFIKSLIDYIKPEKDSKGEEINEAPILTPDLIEDETESLIEEYISSGNEYIEGGDSSSVDEIPEEEAEPLIEEKIENKGIQIEETNIFPVNSNKRKIDTSGNVNINPLLL
jgi:uncharacterized membrane protein